jgi:hypothetical protein
MLVQTLKRLCRLGVSYALSAVILAAMIPKSWAQPATIDAQRGVGEYGTALAVQDTPTGFGDSLGGGSGSELNAAYANLRGDGSLELLLTGNLESNGNGIVIFFDSRAGGAVVETLTGGFGRLGAFGGQRTDDWGNDIDGGEGVFTPAGGSILDPGFNPDFAIEFNVSGADRHINVIDMTVGGNDSSLVNRDVYLGSTPDFILTTTQGYYRDNGTTYSGALTHAFNNGNAVGVNGFDFGNPPGPLGDPLSAEVGLEMHLSSEFLDADEDRPIHILAFITSGSGEVLSNQFLPGVGGVDNLGGVGFLGGEPLFDAREFAGNQYFTVPARVRGDYNGNGVVDAADYTVWRNTTGEMVLPGEGADGERDGMVDNGDYYEWKARYGNTAVIGAGSGTESVDVVPEPGGWLLFMVAVVGAVTSRDGRGSRSVGKRP